MPTRYTTDNSLLESSKIGPDDSRYAAVVDRRFNKRFSAHPDYVRLISSTAQMLSAVEAGATVGETFRALFDAWGTVIPLGEHPQIGMGGHVAGGAFGFLCRQFGLAADYLDAVEVVTVDETRRATAVVATREASDPNRDLWWAHTGGGGGNFGVVTRYWFRSADASGARGSSVAASSSVLTCSAPRPQDPRRDDQGAMGSAERVPARVVRGG